ncbi:MAG: hypothetical protein FD146_908 [Anaerolineaceae bacterium]|nr:MAG: hypothetical protein FD146_908 [Anaerolineaceae bacterium]
MIVFAVVSALVIVIVACVGLICAQFSAEDLNKMGIRQ